MATVTENYELTSTDIIGMRINVFHLVPYFLKPNYTEQQIQELYPLLNLQQVAAARAYFLANYDAVMKRHLEIEARNAAGNPPEVREQMQRGHEKLVSFREWLKLRERGEIPAPPQEPQELMQSFRDWLAQRETNQQGG